MKAIFIENKIPAGIYNLYFLQVQQVAMRDPCRTLDISLDTNIFTWRSWFDYVKLYFQSSQNSLWVSAVQHFHS